MTVASSKYDRLDNEAYFTPAWVIHALLAVETFAGGVWDSGAGDGAILAALPPDMPCYGSDIAPAAPHIKEVDFFDVTGGSLWPNFILNPPYGHGGRLAVRFIEHALDLAEQHGGKVAALLRVDFDSAKTRRHIFGGHPAFAAKYILTRRIRWTNFDQKAAGPTENHAWFVWDWRKRAGTHPVIGYPQLFDMEAIDA